MADIVDTKTRSRMMSGIRGKDTKPELLIRSALHAKGFRFKLHDPQLPGKPDLVFPGRHAAILIHGCFWHGHDCHLFKWPSSRIEFWQDKIERNRKRDLDTKKTLTKNGWRVLTIWECALKGKKRKPLNETIDQAAKWLTIGTKNMELKGTEENVTS